MDTTDKYEQIEKETLGLVLEEFTQEQKTTNQTMNDLIAAVNTIGSKLDDFKRELDNPKSVSVTVNTESIRQIVCKGLTDVKLMIGTQPKSIVRKFQILLFPEQDAKLFYKVIFGRWFLWLVIMLFLTNFYKWGIHYSDNQKEIKMQMIENDRIKKSWDYLYNNNGKEVKKLMEKAYINSEQAEGNRQTISK
ncbi:hypothetical protein [Emticicia sp. TH156]|uniref:hypothetical protein n=1 Tax=Emticicia sp. TH156 TaxID=2067454 RepID=UPI000C790B0A|nr:hypothetical protein [Emticicia sp. TH156]PLK45794.1 hypothetical protein C0V77_00085 [Emticicia sp. TH156]